MRLLRGAEVNSPLASRTPKRGNCAVSMCALKVSARGLCVSHVRRLRLAERAGTAETGAWKLPIYVRRWGTDAIYVRVPRERLPSLKHYAELRGCDVGDAVLELAIQCLAWRSARERDEVHAEAWSRSGPDAMEAL